MDGNDRTPQPPADTKNLDQRGDSDQYQASLERLELAFKLADGGYHLAPVTIGLKPNGKKDPNFHGILWKEASTTDKATIAKWWSQFGENLSFLIDCGKSGIVVLDPDGEGAKDWLSEVPNRVLQSSEIVLTTRLDGGEHHYFGALPDSPIRNSEKKIAPHTDVRGIGGCVFAPGSVIVDSNGEPIPGRIYRTPNNMALVPVTELPPVPDKLVKLCHYVDKAKERVAAGDIVGGTGGGGNGAGGSLWTEDGDHDREWVNGQITKAYDRVVASQTQGGFRHAFRVLVGVLLMSVNADVSGCSDPTPIMTNEDADRMMKDAVQQVWGGEPDEDDSQWARQVAEECFKSGARWTIIDNHTIEWAQLQNVAAVSDTNQPPSGVGAGESVQETAEVVEAKQAKAIDLTLPDEFWETRPVLKHIRHAAWSRLGVPDIALYSLLARMSAVRSHKIVGDAGLGPASLNLFAAIIGKSGDGKSSSDRIAKAFVKADGVLPHDAGYPIGTGEGMAEAYMGEVSISPPGSEDDDSPKRGRPMKKRVQINHNGLFHSDESQHILNELRKGESILGGTIRQGWCGEQLGKFNAHDENRRIVTQDNYSMGITLVMQPSVLEIILDPGSVDVGTPQRFIYVSATEPRLTEEDNFAWPGDLDFDESVLYADENEDQIVITFPEIAHTEVRKFIIRNRNGSLKTNNLDTHWPLMMVKLSSLLALLDNRRMVNEEDWELAKLMWKTSCKVRDNVIAGASKRHESEKRVKQADAGRVAVAKVDAVNRHNASKTEQAAKAIAQRAGRNADKAPTTGDILRHLRNYSDVFKAATDLAEEFGWIELVEVPGKRTKGVIVGPSPVK